MEVSIVVWAVERCCSRIIFKLFAHTGGMTEILLEGLTTGDKLKVRDVNDTNEGPFSPEVMVTQLG